MERLKIEHEIDYERAKRRLNEAECNRNFHIKQLELANREVEKYKKILEGSELSVKDTQEENRDKEKMIDELKRERDVRIKNWERHRFYLKNQWEEGIIKRLSLAIGIAEKFEL